MKLSLPPSLDSIVYIHGFRGSTTSPRLEHIKKAFPGVHVVSPEYDDHDCEQGHKDLDKFFSEHHKKYPHSVVVGTSLGGFWAHRFSNKYKLPSVIVNPATKPWHTLRKYVGGNYTHSHVDAYHKYNDELSKPSTTRAPRSVILAADDDVIDHTVAKSQYHGHAHVDVRSTGGHRFDDHDTLVRHIREVGNTLTEHG